MPLAAIDMGTNSTRLLVVELGDGEPPRQIERRSTVTRLGRGVGSSGRLGADGIEAVCEVVGEYLHVAADLGAEPSSPSRRPRFATRKTATRSWRSFGSASHSAPGRSTVRPRLA